MSIDHGKLLGCPFCGGSAGPFVSQAIGFFVACGTCDSQSSGYTTKAAAIEAWNRRALAQPAEAVDAWPKVVQDECLTVLRNMDAEMHVTSRWSARIRHLIDLIAGMKPAPTDAAQGAVTPFAYGADLTPGDYDMEHSVWLLRPGESVPAGCTPLYTHPQAAPEQGDGKIPISWADFWIDKGNWQRANDYEAFDAANQWLNANLAAAPSQEGES